MSYFTDLSHHQKRHTMCSEPIFILERAHSSLGVLLQPIHQVAWKAASFEWGLEKEKVLQQVQDAV